MKLPVSDLNASLVWYQRVFGAEHRQEFDHVDSDGVRFGAIMQLPGVKAAVELRLAPYAAAAIRGYDPVTFIAGSDDDLDGWVRHLDDAGVDHSQVITGLGGRLVVLSDPDGTYLRLLTMPDAGLDAVRMRADAAPMSGHWLAPHIMRRE